MACSRSKELERLQISKHTTKEYKFTFDKKIKERMATRSSQHKIKHLMKFSKLQQPKQGVGGNCYKYGKNFYLKKINKKQRHYFANRGPSSQRYDFSCSHVWM